MFKRFLQTPQQEYLFIFLGTITLLIGSFVQDLPFDFNFVIITVALIGSFPTLVRACSVLLKWEFSIEVLYLIAILILFFEGSTMLVVFISLIFSLGRLLDFYVCSTSKKITKNFYNKIPKIAFRQNRNVYDEITIGKVKKGDIVIVKEKEVVPVDGVVVYGEGQMNEMSITGLSMTVKKVLNEKAFASAVVFSGVVKIRAMCAGEESIFFEKIKLIKKFSKEVSYSQYFANKLAEYFLPFVFLGGIVLYLGTDNIMMTAALFLVISRRGVTSAVSLHSKKVFHMAVKYGVIVKNSRKFETLGKIKTVILDKTDVLTFGSFQIKSVQIEEGISKKDFWTSVAITEKYSEDLVSKILFREAMKYTENVPDAHKYQVYKGSGICVQYGKDNIVVGNKKLLSEVNIKFPRGFQKKLYGKDKKYNHAIVFVAINNIFVGSITISDVPENDVRTSIKELHRIGVEKVIMFINGDEKISKNFGDSLGVDEIRLSLSNEEKVAEIRHMSKMDNIAVVGGGGADYSTIIPKCVDITMGKDNITISTHGSDILIFNNDLRLLPKLILASRSLTRTIYGNIGIWIVTNATGIAFVLVGVISPVFAVLYSFVIEFINLYLSFGLKRDREKKYAK